MLASKVRSASELFRKKGPTKLFGIIFRLMRNKKQSLYLRTIYNLRYGSSLADPDKILWVDPHKIRYKLVLFFHSWAPDRKQTYYCGGNWDRNKAEPGRLYPQEYDGVPDERTLIRVKDLDWYRSFKAHFHHGVPWEETKLYRRRTNEDYSRRGYSSGDEGLQERLNDIDRLYQNIASEGYKTQAELAQESNTPMKARDWTHEVEVNIGRTGEFILDDGRNRLIVAQILDVPKIPVRVLVRHKQWQELRKDIYNNGLPEEQENIRNHPDLQDIVKKF